MYIGFAYKFIIQDNQMKKSRIIVLSLLLTLLIGTLSFSVMARSDSDQLSFFNQREGVGRLINPLRGRQHGDENWPKLQGHRLDFEAMDETEIEAFQAEIVAERKERLEQAVKAGLLSQEEADSFNLFNQRERMGTFINPFKGRQQSHENLQKLPGQCQRLDFEAMDEVEIAALQAEIVAERKERLEQAVEAGLLSQEEADEILTRIDALDFGQNMGGGLMLGLKRQQKGRGRNFRLTQPE